MSVRMVLCKQLRRSLLNYRQALYRDTLARTITVCAPQLLPRQVRLHRNNQPMEPFGGGVDVHLPAPGSSATVGNSMMDEIKKVSLKAPDSLALRCKELLSQSPDVRKHNLEDAEYSYKTNFGSIRFDKDNLPEDKTRPVKEPSLQSQISDIDEQYFGAALEKERDGGRSTETMLATSAVNATPSFSSSRVNQSDGFIDTQFFGEALQRDANNENSSGKSPVVGSAESLHSRQELNEDKDMNYIDEVFFKEPDVLSKEESSLNEVTYRDDETIEREKVSAIIKPYRRISDFERALLNMDDESCATRADLPFRSSSHTKDMEQRYVDSYKERTTKEDKKLLDRSSATPSSPVSPPPSEQRADAKVPPSPEPEESLLEDDNTIISAASTEKLFHSGRPRPEGNPESAFDYAMSLRRKQRQEQLLESKPDGRQFIPRYKSIINSVLDLKYRNTHDMQRLLKRCIIYNEHDVVALFKPYGLRVQGGGETGHELSRYSLLDLLPQLGEVVGAKAPLHTVHRLDVNTTGVLLLARTEETAFKLRKMFKDHTLVKTYLAIVKGVPSVLHGLIDIPLKECMVENKRRMGLRPVLQDNPKKKHDGTKAVTKFKVLSYCNGTSLVSVQPLTGVKHQIRSHLGLALSCPILADHKYSKQDTILPQKLPGDALDRLQMRQTRVRDLPLMLHASSVFLPRFVDNKNIKISCPPPPHFTSTLKALKLNAGYNVTNIKSMDYVDIGVPLV